MNALVIEKILKGLDVISYVLLAISIYKREFDVGVSIGILAATLSFLKYLTRKASNYKETINREQNVFCELILLISFI